MAEPGTQTSVLQRVKNKNNIADMIYKRKVRRLFIKSTKRLSF